MRFLVRFISFSKFYSRHRKGTHASCSSFISLNLLRNLSALACNGRHTPVNEFTFCLRTCKEMVQTVKVRVDSSFAKKNKIKQDDDHCKMCAEDSVALEPFDSVNAL